MIVHGAWGGGWEWSSVARLLRRRGHDVFTPTLTGMGDHAHLGARESVGLSTHVDDIGAVLEFENLHDVVLCGASYGGVPVTGAADRESPRIGLVVYIDALVPRSGQSALDLLPDGFASAVRAGIREHGPIWRVPMPADLLDTLLPEGALPATEREEYVARLRAQPAATFTEPLLLGGAVEQLPRAFVRCTSSGLRENLGTDPIESCAARARAEGWTYRELPAPHDPQLFAPVATAELLDELVGR